MSTTFGIFQYIYQGTPLSSIIDVGAAGLNEPYESYPLFGRGKWVNMTTDASGNITLGTPYDRRTPWYTQTVFNIAQTFKIKERQSLRFEANVTNLFNQHAVVDIYGGMNSISLETPLYPGVDSHGNPISLASGALLYQTLEHPWNPQQWINGNGGLVPSVTKASGYGVPQQYQLNRGVRLGVTYTF